MMMMMNNRDPPCGKGSSCGTLYLMTESVSGVREMINMDEFTIFSNNIHKDSTFVVEYVGESQSELGGVPLPGPYALFIKPPRERPQYIVSSKTVFWAVKQAKVNQRDWGLPDTSVIISDGCHYILEIESDYYRHVNRVCNEDADPPSE